MNRDEYYIALDRNSKELEHHGILGQKWGKQNGPPYPLKDSVKSMAEKVAAGIETSKQKASENRVRRFSKEKEDASVRGNLAWAIRHSRELSNSEIKTILDRDKILSDLDKAYRNKGNAFKAGQSAINSMASFMKSITDAEINGVNMFNNTARIINFLFEGKDSNFKSIGYIPDINKNDNSKKDEESKT